MADWAQIKEKMSNFKIHKSDFITSVDCETVNT